MARYRFRWVQLVMAGVLISFPMAMGRAAETVPGFLACGTQADQPMNFNVEGKITEKGDGTLTVNSEGNMLFHLRFDGKTQIKKSDGTPGSAEDLKVGAKIKASGDLTESGIVNASKIELE